MTIVQRIFHELDLSRKKPSELARHLGVTSSQVSAWKTRNTDPPAKYLPAICDFLGVTVEYILGITNRREPIKMTEEEEKEFIELVAKEPAYTVTDEQLAAALPPEIRDGMMALIRMELDKHKNDK